MLKRSLESVMAKDKKKKKTKGANGGAKKKRSFIGASLPLVKVKALGNFFDSIDDYLMQEKIWGYFVKFGNNGGVSPEEYGELQKLLAEANVSEEEFLKMTKLIRR